MCAIFEFIFFLGIASDLVSLQSLLKLHVFAILKKKRQKQKLKRNEENRFWNTNGIQYTGRIFTITVVID